MHIFLYNSQKTKRAETLNTSGVNHKEDISGNSVQYSVTDEEWQVTPRKIKTRTRLQD